MKRLFSKAAVFISATIVFSCAFAIESPNREIFRYPHSLFSSGSLPKAQLIENTNTVLTEHWIKASRAGRLIGWINSNQLLSEIDLVTEVTTQKEAPYRDNRVLSENPAGSFKKGIQLKVLEVDDGWAQVRDSQTKPYWVEVEDLAPSSSDWGLVYFPKNTALYLQPRVKSRTIGMISGGEFLKIQGIRGSFFEVNYASKARQKMVGYVHFKQVISRLQFAQSIQVGNKWFDLVPETPWRLKIKNGSRIQIEEIKGFQSQTSVFFSKTPQTLALKSPSQKNSTTSPVPFLAQLKGVEVLNLKWGQATVEGHGNVWWITNLDETPSKSESIRFVDLKKRGIFQIVTHPFKPSIRFASANGLFRTEDGINWERLSFIGEENQPLAISKRGVLFVGNYKSNDLGNSFEPYLRFENILRALSHSQAQNPKKLSITELKLPTKDDKVIRLKVNMGKETPVWIQSTNSGADWKVL